MRIGFARLLIGLALSLPLLAVVGDRLLPQRGAGDAVVAASAEPRRPLVRKAGGAMHGHGVPCRRSAADPREDALPPTGHGRGRNSGCNLRLVKRQPAAALIWV